MNNVFWIRWEGSVRKVAIGGGDTEMVYIPELGQYIPWTDLYSRPEPLEAQAA